MIRIPGDKVSDTPRTDAVRINATMTMGAVVDANFARQLERELAGKQAVIDRLMLEYCHENMTEDQVREWAQASGPCARFRNTGTIGKKQSDL